MSGNKLTRSLLLLIGLIFVSACQPAASPEAATMAPPTVVVEMPSTTAESSVGRQEQPIRILFIGDSFIMGVNEHVEGLAASGDPPMIVESEEIAHGGMILWGHWTAPQTVPTIQEGNWTAVVLQEDLAIPGVDVQKFYEYAGKFHEEIKNIGAETILYMPWQYDNGNPMTIDEIAGAYSHIGAELGGKVAPVGLAWERSIAERPDLDLYADDRTHSNVWGSYLIISVLYATLFDQSPEGIPYLPPDDPSGKNVAFLQRIAWETVVDYQEQNK